VALEFPIELEFRNLDFEEKGNRRTRRKTLRVRTRTNNKLNPLMTPGPGFEPGPHCWEASAFTSAPPILPWFLAKLRSTLELEHVSSCLWKISTNSPVITLGVTDLHNSYPYAITAFKVLLERVYLLRICPFYDRRSLNISLSNGWFWIECPTGGTHTLRDTCVFAVRLVNFGPATFIASHSSLKGT